MPKLKTKSGAKKPFSRTGSGKIRMNPSNKRPKLGKNPKKMKRKARGPEVMTESDARIARKYMPYL